MKLLFSEAYDQYLIYIENRLKIQSKESIRYKFKDIILPYFKDYNIYEIKEIDYIKFQNYINNKNYSYNYKKNIHFVISGFLNYCIKFLGLKENIAKKVGCFKKLNERRKEQDFYTFKEFKHFIKYFDNEIYKQFFILMFFTGTRPGEAMALKFSDLYKYYIDINKTIDEHGTREIGTPKSINSYRQIKIDKKLYKDLIKLKKYYMQKYNMENYDYFLFGGLKPLAPTTINRYKEKACKKANLRKIKLHEFRHSHATLLLNKKIIINEISKRLGHSDVSITLNTYTHTSEEQEKRVIKTLSLIRLFQNF